MKIFKIEAGYFNADGGACFGVVPKRAWRRRYPCDEENFCKLTMRCLLIDAGDRKIIIDTGTGTKQADYLKLYGIQEIADFETELNALGYHCDDITDVILTHLHFDHCGACTYVAADKSLQLTFPHADHWVGQAQWENFLHPNVREGDSYFAENMLPVQAAGKLKLVSENRELCPGVELRLFHGHTLGQLATYIRTETRTFIYVGDVIPTSVNIPLAWVSAYDTFPIQAMSEKKVLLDEAVAENQVLIFEHDAYTECCAVEKNNGKYKAGQGFKLSDLM